MPLACGIGIFHWLESNLGKLWSLSEMERTGGEPDVVDHDQETGEYIFYDCSAESPKGRRNVCYDREGLEARKEFKPETSAIADRRYGHVFLYHNGAPSYFGARGFRASLRV